MEENKKVIDKSKVLMHEIIVQQLEKCIENKKVPSKKLLDTINTYANLRRSYNC